MTEILNEKPRLVILSGLPGAGKSHFRRNWVKEDPDHRRWVNYDESRLSLFGPDWKFNQTDEKRMKGLQAEKAAYYLRSGKSVIIDNLNLTTRARAPWIELAHMVGVQVEQIDLDTPIAECVIRDRVRPGKTRVGQAVIDRWALTTGWIDWNDLELYPKDFIIVDMDGTLADAEHRRHYVRSVCRSCAVVDKFDGMKVGNSIQCPRCGGVEWTKKNWPEFFKRCPWDLPKKDIRDLVMILEKQFHVLIVSGRPIDSCGIHTEDWLLEHLGASYYRHLFMRAGGDSRHDTEVKQEILDLLPGNRIAYVLDDRDDVVKMWRRNGLTCLQVAEGKF